MVRSEPGLRTFAPPVVDIVPATDLGGVGVLKHGELYLLTDPFGDIHSDSRGLGLYAGDTRILSCAIVRINGFRPALLRGDAGENYRGSIQATNPERRSDPGDKTKPGTSLARQSFGIARHRTLVGGLREELVIANYTDHPETLLIELALGVDMADIFEVRGHHRLVRGTFEPIVTDGRHLAFGYLGLDGHLRHTYVEFPEADVEPAGRSPAGTSDGAASGMGSAVVGSPAVGSPSRAAVVVRWRRDVSPGAETRVEWSVWHDDRAVHPDGARSSPAARRRVAVARTLPDAPVIDAAVGAAAYAAWSNGSPTISSDAEPFDRIVERGIADLRLLLNDGPAAGERYVAAGVPWFSTLFGRDSIISAFEAIAVRPSLAVATLEVLAAHQATEDDPTRDAEPGKIAHEIRTGEMARTGELPFGRYYGSVDATPLWLILLGETYDWTGDDALVDRLWPNAMAALDWIDRFGDLDGDGFIEYRCRAKGGLINQGWKDSADSVRFRDGRIAEAPIALAEVQGYVFAAKMRVARLARGRGDGALADRLETDARRLAERFDAAFWVADRGAYAIALDRDKRQADALASNQGQALWSGIVARDHARAVADRLTEPDLDSGWGIRTYAAGQPGFNPLGYHTGSVWPHDNALIVAGLKAYGFDEQANQISTQLLEAARHFPDARLPELFCGFGRDDVPVPVPYPVACSPQAWSAAAPLLLIRAMLGIEAHAGERRLELVRPHLPTWLAKLTITNLRVGDASVDLLFHRWRGATSAEVLRKTGDLEVTIRI
jgi:glycogen debranching enzyme